MMIRNHKKKEILSALADLIDQQVYRNPNLNRSMLANILCTNECYLHYIIKEHTGMSVKNYILSFRLEYARKLLVPDNQKHTIEDVALRSGFRSRKTFYRQFTLLYEITPTNYSKEPKRSNNIN